MTANLDPATRARLADALEGATPEMLRDGAILFVRATAEYVFVPDDVAYRLAALALAVAVVDDLEGLIQQDETGEWEAHLPPAKHKMAYTKHYRSETLAGLLAELLRTSEGA